MRKNEIIIFDTTLRDGEQSPGASMTIDEKVMIAKALDEMGVDVIEAGFAAASPGDFESIEKICKSIKNATVCSLARAKRVDIEAANQSLKSAIKPRIHTFISTSPIHLQHQFKMTQEEVLDVIDDHQFVMPEIFVMMWSGLRWMQHVSTLIFLARAS